MLVEKLVALGAIKVCTGVIEDANFENQMDIDFWVINRNGILILDYHDGDTGIYCLAVKEGATIEESLNFLESLKSSDDFPTVIL